MNSQSYVCELAAYVYVYIILLMLLMFFVLPIPFLSEMYVLEFIFFGPTIFVCGYFWLSPLHKKQVFYWLLVLFACALAAMLIMRTNIGEMMPYSRVIRRIMGADGERAGDARIAEQLYIWFFVFLILTLFAKQVYIKLRER